MSLNKILHVNFISLTLSFYHVQLSLDQVLSILQCELRQFVDDVHNVLGFHSVNSELIEESDEVRDFGCEDTT